MVSKRSSWSLRLNLVACILLMVLVHSEAEEVEVKIVEGKDSDAMGTWSNSWYDSEGYYDPYDSYGSYGDYGGYGGYWDEDDAGEGGTVDNKQMGKSAAPSKVLGNSNATGPLVMLSLHEQCFTTPEIPGEGWYRFCPFRNVSLTYMMRRAEESLAMGWFSHWTTQNINGTVRLAQVYKDGFYCRMGDEHSTVVTFGCQDEIDPHLRIDDIHGNVFIAEEGEAGDESNDSWPSFNISSVTRGTYDKDSGYRASVNGTVLKGEADYWSAEDTGCVYKLHFMLPFSCADLGPLGFSANVDTPPAGEDSDGAATVTEVEVDGSVRPGKQDGTPSSEEVLAAWRAWGVRLKDGLGASAEEIGRLQQQLSDFRASIASAGASADKSSGSSGSATTSSSSSSTIEKGGSTVDNTHKEERVDSASPSSSSCSCCDELSEVKSKLKQLV